VRPLLMLGIGRTASGCHSLVLGLLLRPAIEAREAEGLNLAIVDLEVVGTVMPMLRRFGATPRRHACWGSTKLEGSRSSKLGVLLR
jgi:hypothetical protein